MISSNNSFFQFFYYSFNTFVFNTISEIVPSQPISQLVSIIEKFFALMLVAIFASLLISIRSQRSSKEVDDLISLLGQQGRRRELIIRKDFKISLDEAISELEKWRAGTAKLFLILSGELDSFMEDDVPTSQDQSSGGNPS